MTLEELQDIFEQYQKANYPKQNPKCAREAVLCFYTEILNNFTEKGRKSIRKGLAQQYGDDEITYFFALKMINELKQIWDEYRPQLTGEGLGEQDYPD